MNFYTFNSKKILRNFTFFVLSLFVVYNLLLDTALQIYVDRKTSKNSFVEEKVSKAKHMKLQDDAMHLDYIFIGSSRTIYHISTQQFKDNGIFVYNFGVSDRALVDYPYMIKEAISLKPTHIVINLTVKALFLGEIGNYNYLTIEDLKYLYEFHGIDSLFTALKKYVQSKHLLFKHSEPINIRFNRLYTSFDPQIEENESITSEHKNKKILKTDCKIFDRYDPSQEKSAIKCTNGDGVLFGNTIKDIYRKENFKMLNDQYIKNLNALLNIIHEDGIIPIVILEPVFREQYTYTLSKIKKNINAKVIDLTKMYIPDEYWADDKHLNVQGRTIYTDKLIDILQK